MPDIFDQISTTTQAPQNGGDIFDQVSNNLEQPYVKENPGNHPTYGAHEVNFNPITAAGKGLYQGGVALSDEIKKLAIKANPNNPGIAEYLNNTTPNPLFNGLKNIPEPMPGTGSSLAQGISKGAVESIPAMALSGPMGMTAGMGTAGALSAVANNENPVMAFAKDAALGKAYSLAGSAGSSLIPSAKRLGSALGGGVGGAITSGGNPESIASGVSFNTLFPQEPFGAPKTVTPQEHANIIDKGSEIYRHILNPGKGIINKIEIKSGKDINDSMALAAKMGLPLEGVEGKLDTRKAVDIVKQAPQPLYEQQNQILSSNPDKQFNLEDLGADVKNQLSGKIKNASELADAHSKVDNEINAEILRHGTKLEDGTIDPNVDGVTLNKIKQGMWSKSYNPMEPNANDTARQIGYVAKDAIEKAYDNDAIKENNQKIGQYLQLQKVLEATHGQIIQGGKIGGYAAQGIGALAGHASHIPGAEIAGGYLGGKVKSFLNDPARITGDWAKKIGSLKVESNEPVELSESNSPVANPVGPMSDINPLKSPQQGGEGEIKVKEGKFGNKGQLGNNNIEKQKAYINSLESSASDFESKGDIGSAKQLRAQAELERRKLPKEDRNIGLKMSGLGMAVPIAGFLGAGSVFNPINSQAQSAKKQEVMQMPAGQYTMTNEGKGVKGKAGWPYIDTLGNKTVGYGFKMDGDAAKYIPEDVKSGHRAMTEAEMTNAFNHIYPKAIARAEKFAGPVWQKLSQNQQKALADMSYQMEGHLNGFHSLKAAIQAGHFNTAAREILNSKYARTDAPNRAKQNAILIQQ